MEFDRRDLTFVYDEVALGRDDRRLRRDDQLTRMRRGAYLPRETAAALDPDERYRARIHAVLGTRRSPVVLSHASAARLWGMPMITGWPWHVQLTVAPESPRRSKNGVVVHRALLAPADVVELDGVLLTSPSRTVVDLARSCEFVDAVGAADDALHRGLVSAAELVDRLGELGESRGSRIAARALGFASALSESPGESFSRAVMHECGFPEPELQHEFALRGGTRRVDFWWPDLGVIGEFDGRVKYQADAEAAIWREKQRENELAAVCVGLVRWTWQDVLERTPLILRLESAGVRARRPRGFRARSGR